MNSLMSLLVGGVTASTILLAGSAQAMTTSTLYLTQYGTTQGAIVQGDSVVGTFTTGTSTETAIAVGDTVRIMNAFSGGAAGSEYDLSGNVISPGAYSNTQFNSLYDGTTDGTYNYSIAHNQSGLWDRVLQFDLDWNYIGELFTMTQRGSGISYDQNSNTMWVTGGSGAPNGGVQQYAMDGTLLSSFALQQSLSYGLAFDAADNTVWASEWGTNDLYQYSTSGTLLQVFDAGGALFSNAFGMEFGDQVSAVPVPAGLPLLLGAMGILGIARRRRS